MEIRHAVKEDIHEIMRIYEYARRFMAEHGNPDQWGPTNWPPEALIRQDIANGSSYVCIHEDKIVGTFFFEMGKEIEPAYCALEGGVWMEDSPYGVIHRLAGSGAVHGVGSFCVEWAYRQCGHLRMDTHGDNYVMQNLLKKSLFIIGICSITMFCLAELLAQPFSVIFVGYDPDLMALTQKGFRIFSFSFLFAGIAIYGSSFFTALGNGLISALISFLRTLLFQTAAVLIFPLLWGIDGIWISIAAAELMAAAVTALFLIKKRSKYHY